MNYALMLCVLQNCNKITLSTIMVWFLNNIQIKKNYYLNLFKNGNCEIFYRKSSKGSKTFRTFTQLIMKENIKLLSIIQWIISKWDVFNGPFTLYFVLGGLCLFWITYMSINTFKIIDQNCRIHFQNVYNHWIPKNEYFNDQYSFHFSVFIFSRK